MAPNFLIVELCWTFPKLDIVLLSSELSTNVVDPDVVSDFNKNLVLVQLVSSEIFTLECYKYSVSNKTANCFWESMYEASVAW